MRLCFDATAFGADLESAIELASAYEIGAIEYSFAPFAPSTASKQELKAELQEERLYFEGLRARADAGGVSFAVSAECGKVDSLLAEQQHRSPREVNARWYQPPIF